MTSGTSKSNGSGWSGPRRGTGCPWTTSPTIRTMRSGSGEFAFRDDLPPELREWADNAMDKATSLGMAKAEPRGAVAPGPAEADAGRARTQGRAAGFEPRQATRTGRRRPGGGADTAEDTGAEGGGSCGGRAQTDRTAPDAAAGKEHVRCRKRTGSPRETSRRRIWPTRGLNSAGEAMDEAAIFLGLDGAEAGKGKGRTVGKEGHRALYAEGRPVTGEDPVGRYLGACAVENIAAVQHVRALSEIGFSAAISHFRTPPHTEID